MFKIIVQSYCLSQQCCCFPEHAKKCNQFLRSLVNTEQVTPQTRASWLLSAAAARPARRGSPSWIIRQSVKHRRTSDSKCPPTVSAEAMSRYGQLMTCDLFAIAKFLLGLVIYKSHNIHVTNKVHSITKCILSL